MFPGLFQYIKANLEATKYVKNYSNQTTVKAMPSIANMPMQFMEDDSRIVGDKEGQHFIS